MAASSTVVDLSRLPAPAIVPLMDFAQIRSSLIADLQARLPGFDATVASDPAVKLIEVAAFREQLLRQQFQDAALQLLVAYATGGNLDHLAALVGVTRLVITPADAQTGAAAVMEGDDALRLRVVLAPEAFSCAGPELAYVAIAKAAAGDVLDASATSPAPGEVLVSVLSRNGDGAAPPALVATVQAAVADPAVRPLGDQVTTASATIVPFAIAAALTTFSGPDVALVIAAAEAKLAAYLAANRKLGRDITISGLHAALTVAGVEKVELNLDDDVVCGPTEAPYCTAIAVTHAGFV